MNEPTTIGGINELLRRRFGVPGQSGPVLSIASDLFPVLHVGDRFMDADLARLAGTYLCEGARTDVAAAANNSSVQLYNPTGSGVVGVLEYVGVTLGAGGLIDLFYLGAPFVSDATALGYTRDLSQNRRTVLTLGDRTYVPGVTPVAQISGTGSLQEIPLTPIVVPPGTGIQVTANPVNNLIRGLFRWRERALQSWETTA